MAVKGMVPILVGMMLLTGCSNTLLTKYQVHLHVELIPSYMLTVG
jgi:hypothetical protein